MKKKLAKQQAKSVNSLKGCPSNQLPSPEMLTFQLVALVSPRHQQNQISTQNEVLIGNKQFEILI